MTQNQKLLGPPPILIAHRGYSGRYPENTLLAYEAAYEYGARYMELDLQLSADQVPIVHHDANLQRMAGVDLDIRDTKTKHIKSLKASYSERFDDEFLENDFTTFRKLCKWLQQHSDVTMFVEIKQESIDRFGVPLFVDEVDRRILKANVASQCVIISFNDEVINYSRKVSSMRTGWVLPKFNETNKELLEDLKPDFLFWDKNLLPESDEEIWRGSWLNAVYNLDDVSSAIAMANRGIQYLETNQIGTLMADADLSNRSS